MEHPEYPVKPTPAEAEGFVVTCRDLPELITQGENLHDALNEARDAMDEIFATYSRIGITRPPASPARAGEYLVGLAVDGS